MLRGFTRRMKLQIKFLGLVYSAFGGVLGLFVLFLLLTKTLTSLGIMKDDGKSPNFYVALSISVLLMTVAMWFFQTGWGLWNLQSGSRLMALVIGGILLLSLNVLLMLTNDPPRTAKTGMTVFHLSCITLGLYTLVILWPGWGRRAFEQTWKRSKEVKK
jgi:hypothetical protein